MNRVIVEDHLQRLSYAYVLNVQENYAYFIARDFLLPPGYDRQRIDIWTEIPRDYPESPPGVGGSHVYVPSGLKYHGKTPRDYHPWTGPSGWAWWCYQWIEWDSRRDDFIAFFEVIRTHMTNPR